MTDGMGGEKGGEIASSIVSELMPKCISAALEGMDDPGTHDFITKVEQVVSDLSFAVFKAGNAKPELEGMGATLTMALIRNSKALIVNIGDSRAYLVRSGRIEQVTKDHSVVQLLLDNGEITQEEADKHPFRGQLLKCMGMRGYAVPDCFLIALNPKDKLLLCSDGLTDMVSNAKLWQILSSSKSTKKACERLRDAANNAGGNDNITALVIEICAVNEP